MAMTGDGTNDAPALAQADVGLAMNSGTAAAKDAANMVDLDSDPTKVIEVVRIGKELLMTRGAVTTFSIANDVAKYFAIIPALFAAALPGLDSLNIMRLATPQSAIVSAVIFNALIIVALVPLCLRGVRTRARSRLRHPLPKRRHLRARWADRPLRRHQGHRHAARPHRVVLVIQIARAFGALLRIHRSARLRVHRRGDPGGHAGVAGSGGGLAGRSATARSWGAVCLPSRSPSPGTCGRAHRPRVTTPTPELDRGRPGPLLPVQPGADQPRPHRHRSRSGRGLR